MVALLKQKCRMCEISVHSMCEEMLNRQNKLLREKGQTPGNYIYGGVACPCVDENCLNNRRPVYNR